MILSLWGYETRSAHSGRRAPELAAGFRPDVIVLDLAMPGLDGYEVAERLRTHPDLKDIVLVAVSGYGQERDRRRSKEAGFAHHLVKPTEPEELTALLEAVARGGGEGPSPTRRHIHVPVLTGLSTADREWVVSPQSVAGLPANGQ